MRNLKMNRAAILLLAAAGIAQGTTQGPDAFGYKATDQTPYSFVDISAGGAASILSGIDDGSAALTLPFAFSFYGTSYTNVCVSANGAIYFVNDPTICTQFNNGTLNDAANTDLTATAAPGDLPGIFPFWTDLDFSPAGAGSVFYQTIGTTGSRQFIIQWQAAYPEGDSVTVTFQTILAEGTNSVTFQHSNVALGAGDPNNDGLTATVAIRNAAGQTNGQVLQWSFDAAVLSNNYAILIETSAAPGAPTLTFPLSGASSVSSPVALTWNAGATATAYDVYLDTANPPVATVATNLSALTFTTASLTAGTTYYWKVVAKNGAGSTPSTVSSFTTAAPGGGGPGIVLSVLSWATPAPITYGTPLGPNQLDATANVPGFFTYNPPAGTILNVGQQVLRANFSGGGVATVTLTVNPAPQTITFAPLPNRTSDSAPFTVSATASSGLPVAFSIASGPATITGNTITITGVGIVVVQASQAGNANYTAALAVTQPFTVTIGTATISGIVSGASFTGSAIASDAISSLFGNGLASQPLNATTLPLPTTLGGVTVTVTDSTGTSLPAQIIYVSFNQVNFVTPEGLAIGNGTVTVTNPANKSFTFSTALTAILPALFTANSTGSGPAAAQYVTINPDGSSVFTPSFTCTSSGCTTVPIPLGGNPVYLALYGTGIRGRSSLSAVTATIGGVSAPVIYAGTQQFYAGLDQVNIPLSPSLAGKGAVTVQLTMDGVALNPVTIRIQ
jgi:uncharacterized protein (TIGR03437 family)